ncbi:fatty acid desaturase [Acidimangrovimonas sediminis]|uniref:fatty acid desaturase n=1 Tax=Acidimangrovimonas sediminis TaxID=2056283 RepID=UPI0018ED3480|nr:fatty acid desaturase [Acidimangrovimonas sediminis]
MAELSRTPTRLWRDEAPTLALLALVYLLWGWGTSGLWSWSPLLGWGLTALAIVQFSSLQHEVLHGHPFRSRRLNEALVFAGLTLFVPYRRFRDTHIAHHRDPMLTDPYDDPETNFLDPDAWARLSRPVQRLRRLNNTLLGRVLLGPVIGTVAFVQSDLALARAGDRGIARAWILHGLGVLLVLAWLWTLGAMPLWAYLLAAYAAFGVLKIRTFLEHRAEEEAAHRTVLVEDRGPLAFLFLFNNLHAVHHLYPGVAWHRLPRVYAEGRAQFRAQNGGYVYRSYAQIIRRHLLTPKDPVPHPFYRPGR